ncbi:hypothetical protein ACFOSH_35285, partial [Amycolatopsis speibonae]
APGSSEPYAPPHEPAQSATSPSPQPPDQRKPTASQYVSKAQSAGHVRDDLAASDLADAILALSDGFANRMLTSTDPAALLPSLETSVRTLLTP